MKDVIDERKQLRLTLDWTLIDAKARHITLCNSLAGATVNKFVEIVTLYHQIAFMILSTFNLSIFNVG